MPGRLTIGLWNSYDARKFHEAHRRVLARSAALALGFEANVATFGFPYEDLAAGGGRVAERRGARARAEARRGEPEAEGLPLRTPLEVARAVAASTSIGGEAASLVELAEAGRFTTFPFPERGFPPQLGRPILTTSKVDPSRSVTVAAVAADLRRGTSVLLVFGLGPHGPGREAREACREDLDVTGRGQSLETATALGAVVAALAHAA